MELKSRQETNMSIMPTTTNRLTAVLPLKMAALTATLWAVFGHSALAKPHLVVLDNDLFNELNGLVNRGVLVLDLSTSPISANALNDALKAATLHEYSDNLTLKRIKEKLADRRDNFTLSQQSHSTPPPAN